MKKRFFPVLLALLLLCGCGAEKDEPAGGICFYYPRSDILYGAEDGVIAAEEQEVAPGEHPAQWLLEDYLAGPDDPQLRSPFPAGTKLLELRQENEHLILILSDEFFTLEGISMTLACASLSKTCFSITGATELTLRSSDSSQRIVLAADSFIFTDDGDPISMTIGTEPAA